MTAQSPDNINQILGLVELAEDKSPTQRKFLYEKIGSFLLDDSESFSMAEKELMADILCRITSDVEHSIRSHFAKHIATREDIPHDLIVFLANDDIEISLPILRDCGLLDETDLIEVVHTRSVQHQLAVAARMNISEQVSKALCDTNNKDVCIQLLNNQTANIAEPELEFLAMESQHITAYQKPLLARPFLPEQIAIKMYRWVSIALREYITQNFKIDPSLLQIDTEEREETIRSISSANDPSQMLVDKLHKAGELSNGFLLKSLRQGEIDLFEISFAKLLDLTRNEVQKILYGDDLQLLAVACKMLELEKVVFATLIDLVDQIHHNTSKMSAEDREEVLTFFTLLKPEAAARAIQNKSFINGDIRYYQTN
ncbi:MAG: DUF2336 domain-containing protein [Sneathiella sp.]|nr:DUF2336 domain-containing protein [Sneathiella sp.]